MLCTVYDYKLVELQIAFWTQLASRQGKSVVVYKAIYTVC